MRCLNSTKREHGAALIALLLILGLGVSSYYLHTFDHAKLKRERAQNTRQALGDAKTALMAWAVGNSVNLGQLPMPDRGRGGGYDGFSDCSPSGTAFHEPASYRLLLGKLPVYGQTSPCVGQQIGLGLDNAAHLEHRFWYAVSRNVVHQYAYLSADPRSNPTINPSMLTQPNYPWLKVIDHHGQLISDRVAAVIIAPGDNVSDQSRVDGAAPDQFLDAIALDGNMYANHDYDSADEDFVMSATATESRFNDQLVYITIDELIAAINKRVVAESEWLLSQYALNNKGYPNAADLRAETIQHDAYIAGASQAGFVPFDVTDRCQCLHAEQCTCSFGVVASVTMRRRYGTWKNTEDSGACTSTLKASGKTCTCTGAGSCSRRYAGNTTRFACDTNGRCQAENLKASDENQFIYTLADFAAIDTVSSHCTLFRGEVRCNGAGAFDIGLNEADWIKHNDWQQYLYYVSSPTQTLQAGEQQGLQALLIATGPPIHTEASVSQSRPSSRISDYLDSVENTDGDAVYASVLKRVNSQYNDQVFVIGR